MTTPNPAVVKKKMPKAAKVAIWIGSSVVGLVVIMILVAAISIGNQPGGWEAAMAKQKAESSAKASLKAADAAADEKAKFEAAAAASKASATASAQAASSASAKASADASQKIKDAASKANAEATASAQAAKVKSDAEAKTAAQAQAAADAAAKEKSDAAAKAKTAAEGATAAKQAAGQKYFNAWLTSRGASSSAEVLLQSPGNVQGYLVSAESPSPGTAVFTAQLTKNDVTKAELEQAAMAVLQLVGYDDESLDRVEIVTADSLLRGVANRHDSPLLNLNK